MNGKKWGLALVLLLLLGGAAGAYYAFRTDPNMAKVADLRKQMDNKDLTDEQRRALWGQMRETFESLTPEQRQELRRNRGPDRWAAKMQQDMAKYFAMSAKEKRKYLDQQIDDMVKRRKEREKQQQLQQQQNAQASSNNNNNNNGQGARGQGGGQGGGGGDRNQQRRLALDNSSAASRALGSDFRRDMATRMQQRGIPPGGGGFGGGGFGGGGRRGY